MGNDDTRDGMGGGAGRFSRSPIDTQGLLAVAWAAFAESGFDKRRESVLLDVPLHQNVGDSLITLGEFAFLAAGDGHRLAHVGWNRDALKATLERIPAGANILLHGGGNLGDLWPRSQEYRLAVTAAAPESSRVIWLPQSVHFVQPMGELATRTREVIAAHKPAVLLRDQQSIDVWRRLFDVDAILCPDMGLLAPVLPKPQASHATAELKLLRRDQESAGANIGGPSVDWSDAPSPGALDKLLLRMALRVAGRPPTALVRARGPEVMSFKFLSSRRVARGIRLLGNASIVETDRLHAAILALLLGKTVVAHDNTYGKISAVLGTWHDHLDDRVLTVKGPSCGD